MLNNAVGLTREEAAFERGKAGEITCIELGSPLPLAFAMSHSAPESVGRVLELMLCETKIREANGVRLL